MVDSRIENVFCAALEKATPNERQAYLDGACHRDMDLRARVETLLRAHDEAAGFLAPGETTDSLCEGQGTLVGRYKLLQRIGEGGFGIVYMAEQTEPIRRKVALKIIKLGMDTRQVVARFESERQALALMDHSNIARVLDAGATASGRPYFVMELVKGISITEYCDQNNLDISDRLRLFVPICQAVQHAHQKGIIHRDLKPSNVLVTSHDGVPVPKVIDFGIAKATNQRLTEKTLFTEFKQFIGTPQYMSPEQAEMSGLDVDTRSDIYSLGVLLYELLTGTTPFNAERLRTASYSEIQRIIREEEPPSPSQRVSTLGDQLPLVARRRNVDPSHLPRDCRGDLDWIVMKSLEKDRTRRYATANDLGGDVQRFLSHQMVLAGPPSTWYRARKFVRRNRWAVSAVALITIAIGIGLGLAAVGFVQARRETARSQTIADFLQQILAAAADPQTADIHETNVEAVAARSRELFGEDHSSVPSVLMSLGLQFERTGNLDGAEQAYRESVRLWQRLHGPRHAQVGFALARLGSLLHAKGNDSEAEPVLMEAIAIADSLPGPARIVGANARGELAAIKKQLGRMDEAETLIRESLQIRRAAPARQQYFIGSDLEQLTGLLSLSGKDKEAEAAFEEMLATYRPMFAPNSLPLAWQNAAFGLWLRQRGKLDKAENYLREAVRIYRMHPTPPRDLYLATLDGLFQIVRRRDEDVDESIDVFRECMENMSYLYGPDHLLLAPHLVGFAKELEERNRCAEAIPMIVDGVRIYRKSKGDGWDSSTLVEMLERHVARVVLPPAQSTEKYEVALSGASAILAERPGDEAAKLWAGAAYHRLGNYEQSLAMLAPVTATSADAASSDKEREQLALRHAFLAMGRLQTGDKESARQSLAEMNRWVELLQSPVNKDGRLVFHEARKLVGEN